MKNAAGNEMVFSYLESVVMPAALQPFMGKNAISIFLHEMPTA